MCCSNVDAVFVWAGVTHAAWPMRGVQRRGLCENLPCTPSACEFPHGDCDAAGAACTCNFPYEGDQCAAIDCVSETVVNPTFEHSTDGIALVGWYHYYDGYTLDSTEEAPGSVPGAFSARVFLAGTSGKTGLRQDVSFTPACGNVPSTLRFSAASKAVDVVYSYRSSGYSLYADVRYTSGISTTGIYKFNPGTHDWEEGSFDVVLDLSRTVDYIRVTFYYRDRPGTAYFGNFRVCSPDLGTCEEQRVANTPCALCAETDKDVCGTCFGNVTDLCLCGEPLPAECNMDCFGVRGGSAVYDICQVCGGNGTSCGTCPCIAGTCSWPRGQCGPTGTDCECHYPYEGAHCDTMDCLSATVTNPTFEYGTDGVHLDGWDFYYNGYTLDQTDMAPGAFPGAYSAHVTLGGAASGKHGLRQAFVYTPGCTSTPQSLRFSAWSKALGVDYYRRSTGYSFYAQVYYVDGGSTTGSYLFAPGTHDWEKAVVDLALDTANTIESMRVTFYFRDLPGDAWLGDFRLCSPDLGTCDDQRSYVFSRPECCGVEDEDACGVCFGSTTDPCACADPVTAGCTTRDCSGTVAGPLSYDLCGTCGGTINTEICDCPGQEGSRDACGVCLGGETDFCACPGNEGVRDVCGTCQGLETDPCACADPVTAGCITRDCGGTIAGTLSYDLCGTCGGLISDPCLCADPVLAGCSNMDCRGVVGGTVVYDVCGKCGGLGACAVSCCTSDDCSSPHGSCSVDGASCACIYPYGGDNCTNMDCSNTAMVNADFAAVDPATGLLAGWDAYYEGYTLAAPPPNSVPGSYSVHVMNAGSTRHGARQRWDWGVGCAQPASLRVSVSSKAVGIDYGSISTGYGYYADVYYTDGSRDHLQTGFSTGTHDWEELRIDHVVPSGKSIEKLRLTLVLRNRPGEAYFGRVYVCSEDLGTCPEQVSAPAPIFDATCMPVVAGEACDFAFQCASRSCSASGICCNEVCDGACETCDASGTCVAVAVNTDDPTGLCLSAAGGPCGYNGMCSGLARGMAGCTFAASSTECVSAPRCNTLTDGVYTAPIYCSGTDSQCPLVQELATPCAPYVCAGDACLTTCDPLATESQCSAGYTCNSGGQCVSSNLCAENDTQKMLGCAAARADPSDRDVRAHVLVLAPATDDPSALMVAMTLESVGQPMDIMVLPAGQTGSCAVDWFYKETCVGAYSVIVVTGPPGWTLPGGVHAMVNLYAKNFGARVVYHTTRPDTTLMFENDPSFPSFLSNEPLDLTFDRSASVQDLAMQAGYPALGFRMCTSGAFSAGHGFHVANVRADAGANGFLVQPVLHYSQSSAADHDHGGCLRGSVSAVLGVGGKPRLEGQDGSDVPGFAVGLGQGPLAAAVVTDSEGREAMHLFWAGMWSDHYPQPMPYGLEMIWLQWATRGVYQGRRRPVFTPQLDGYFIPADPDKSGSRYQPYRMTYEDMAFLVERLDRLNTDLPTSGVRNLTLEMVFNIKPVDPLYENPPPYGGIGVDPLANAMRDFAGQPILFTNHGWTHGPLETFSYEECLQEIQRNMEVAFMVVNNSAQQVSAFSSMTYVPGSHAGSRHPPFLNALIDSGHVGVNYPPGKFEGAPIYWHHYFGVETTLDFNGVEGLLILPRLTTSLAIRSWTPEHLVFNENSCNSDTLTCPGCATGDLACGLDYILEDSVRRKGFYVSMLRRDSYFAHDSHAGRFNGADIGLDHDETIITLWMRAMLRAHHRVSTLAVETWQLDDSYLDLATRRQRELICRPEVIIHASAGQISSLDVAGAADCDVPITAPAPISTSCTFRSEVYGPDRTTYPEVHAGVTCHLWPDASIPF